MKLPHTPCCSVGENPVDARVAQFERYVILGMGYMPHQRGYCIFERNRLVRARQQRNRTMVTSGVYQIASVRVEPGQLAAAVVPTRRAITLNGFLL